MAELTQADFEKLLDFRVALRRFERWSEARAREAGLTHVQHQLLLAIKGHPGDRPPAVGDLAGYMLLRPHSTVELIDRAQTAGLVSRVADERDGRVVRVVLTARGDAVLAALTTAHLERLHGLAAVLDELVRRLPEPSGGGWRLPLRARRRPAPSRRSRSPRRAGAVTARAAATGRGRG